MILGGNDGSGENEPSDRQYGCRFLKAPFPECYCMNITGANIPKILLYCSGDYASCRVYVHNTKTVHGNYRMPDRIHHHPER